MGTSEDAGRRRWARVAAWALAYLITHLLGGAVTDPVRHVTVFWPASGVTLAALLTSPPRDRPLVLGTLLVLGLATNIALYGAVAMSLGFSLANALDALLGLWLITWVARREVAFTHVDEVLALAGAATLGNALTSLIGAASSAHFANAPFWAAYRTWWSGALLGVVLLTPFLVVALRPPPDQDLPPRRLERAAFIVAWCAAAWITLWNPPGGPVAPRPYMLVCLLPWVVLRLGLRTVTASMLLLGAAVITAAHAGRLRGFEGAGFTDDLMGAQLYVVLAAITGLVLGASTIEARTARVSADRSASRLTLALDAARMGTWEWKVGSGHVDCSEQVTHLFGIPPQSFGHTYEAFLALVHPEDRASVVAEIERALQPTSTGYAVVHRITRSDGATRWLETRGRVDRDEHGAPVRMAGTVVDITEQRQVAERLRQTQKMEAFGQLAGGVAHDFNNLLAVIMMQAEIGRRSGVVGEAGRPLLDEIVGAAERGAALTKQLLAFTRRQVVQPKPVDLHAALGGVTSMLRRVLPDEVRVRVELSPSPLRVRVDAGMLDQVIVNLAVNARDAMPQGGELTIATELVVVTSEDAEGVVPGTYVAIRVSDTGTGIPAEQLPRLFEPFFTTKPPGKGTGLGLATVFGILRLHHGFINVRSEVGKGTTFEVLLPPCSEAPERAAPPPSEPPRARRRETILLVEDDARVRQTTRTVLEMHDYQVIEAQNGAEALHIWETEADRIDLLFTDMTMPGPVDGLQLAGELRRRRPRLKVVLTSGYSAHISGELEPGTRFLRKPSAVRELLDTVSEALAP